MRRSAGAVLTLLLATAGLAGCGGGGPEPVTPPVASPARAASLAGRYEPNLRLDRRDGFWPVAVHTIDRLRRAERRTCLALEPDARCVRIPLRELPWNDAPSSAYLDYPSGNDVGDQRRDATAALGDARPGTGARMYYFVTGRDRDRPVTLQYWFYYPFNYLPLRAGPVPLFNADLHEGDFEGMAILLSARTLRPVYVWMPRHRDEGERFTWTQGALRLDEGGHPIGYVAIGSHATYESCGRKFRTAFDHGRYFDIPDDHVCRRETYSLGSGIPALNLARTWWACWPGHFGNAPRNSAKSFFGVDYGAVAGELFADGPRSPLLQQKFDLRDPRPCDAAPEPAPPEGSGEALPGRETAAALGAAGGRLNELFRSCADWRQRPPQGSYMVACDPATLEGFFESGLEEEGDQDLRIDGDPSSRGPSVPAVFAAGEPDAVERATITAARPAEPKVYAAVRAGERLLSADFGPFPLGPDQRIQLRRGDSEWRLVDRAAGGRVVARAEVRVSKHAVEPRRPEVVSAERDGGRVEVRFRGGSSPATDFVVYADVSAEDLVAGGRPVGGEAARPSGAYRTVFDDPGGRFRFVRVVAITEGALTPSDIAAVSQQP